MKKNSFYLSLLTAILAISAGFAHHASAAAGDIRINGTREGNNGIIGGNAVVSIQCSGGTFTILGSTNPAGIVTATPPGGADCNNGETVDVSIVQTGYVTTTVTAAFTYASGSDETVNAYTISNIPFQLKAIIADELGNAITASDIDTKTFNGTAAALTVGSTAYWAVAASNAALVLNEANYQNSGSTNTGFSDVSTSASAQTVITLGANTARTTAVASGTSITAKGFTFAHKITVTRQGDGAPVTGATVTAGANDTACTDGGSGNYYCPVPLADDGTANDVSVTKSGYVSHTTGDTTDRTAETDAQGTVAVELSFALRVTVADELGTSIAISDIDTITFDGNTPDYSTSNTAYWAVAGTNAALVIAEDGYQASASTNTGFTDITTGSTLQTSIRLGANSARTTAIPLNPASTNLLVKGLVYAVKTTVTALFDGTPITAATITAGSADTACTESGSTGVYYCPVPLADTEATVTVVKTGYGTKETAFVDRTSAADEQRSVSVSISVPSISSSGSAPTKNKKIKVVPLITNPTPYTLITGPANIQAIAATILKSGARGNDVAELQNFLLRYVTGLAQQTLATRGGADGIFGPATVTALKQWQMANGLAGDGIYGPKTKAKMLLVK